MKERNYSIDFARLACMFMVVLLHNLGQGGVLDWSLSTTRSLVYMTLENYAIVAVNIFALISGYLFSGRVIRAARVFDLWSSAFFWSGSLALLGLARGITPGAWSSSAFFPLLGNVYWYLSAFFVLQLLIPLISPGIKHMGKRKTLYLSGFLIAACSIIGSANERGIGDGYSAFWLMLLWLAGYSLRINRELIARWFSTFRLFVVAMLLPLCITWLEWCDVVAGCDPHHQSSYMAPLVVIQSFCLFELLIRIKINDPGLRRILTALSGSAFGVYLIDSSGWFYGIWLYKRFSWINSISAKAGAPLILLISLLMFVVFLLLETLRRQLFIRMSNLLAKTVRAAH